LPDLTVIYWRDLPAQVSATGTARSARIQLSDRFQKAIDAAAMRAGLVGSDEYLDEWRRVTRPCGEDLEREAAEEAAKLEERYTADELRRLIRAGGREG
jgi:hypothetical protein